MMTDAQKVSLFNLSHVLEEIDMTETSESIRAALATIEEQEAELAKYRTAVAEFCRQSRHGVDAWKEQAWIAPLFALAKERKP